ncbi:ATP-binding protein [Variovorax sp. YR752]|uniref:ATP-binding protein n=1 Tax=Variovorax sp. YR752 TaxID=1884383 RepID=UPI003137F3E9
MASSQFVVSCVTPVAPVPGALLHALHADIGFPSAAARAAAWRRALAACGRSALPQAIEQVAIRFVMGAGQIEQAANEEGLVAAVAGPGELSFAALAGAARAQCGAQLGNLAQRIVPQAELASLVLPSDLHAQLRELCARVATREAVRRDWAAGSVHARVVGVTALFAGPSGTGKTLAAEAIAHELGFDLYRIDLASIVSKYIGETEQNLDRVFRAAEHANAVLFFDEADALFGKRSAVKDAHDRYANIEVAYLLQKMEQFDGLAVLATNLKQNLDEAFARRLTFTLNFPFPEQPQRRQLWESLWPPRAPRGADVDFDWLASEFRFSGGNISNTLLAAAHLAAADGQIVMQSHVLRATRREFQKLGKSIAEPARGMVNGAT